MPKLSSPGSNALLVSMTELVKKQSDIINSNEFQSFKKIVKKPKKGYCQLFLSLFAKKGTEAEELKGFIQNLKNPPEIEMYRLFEFMKRKEIASVDELIEAYSMAQGFKLGRINEINMVQVSHSFEDAKLIASSQKTEEISPELIQNAATAASYPSIMHIASKAAAAADPVEKTEPSVAVRTDNSIVSGNELPEEVIKSQNQPLPQPPKTEPAPVVETENTRTLGVKPEILNSQPTEATHVEDNLQENSLGSLNLTPKMPSNVSNTSAPVSEEKTDSDNEFLQDIKPMPTVKPEQVKPEEERLYNRRALLKQGTDDLPSADHLPLRSRIKPAPALEPAEQQEKEDLEQKQRERDLNLRNSLQGIDAVPEDPSLPSEDSEDTSSITAKKIEKSSAPSISRAEMMRDRTRSSMDRHAEFLKQRDLELQKEMEKETDAAASQAEAEEDEDSSSEDDPVFEQYVSEVPWKFLNASERLGKCMGKHYVIRFDERYAEKVEAEDRPTVNGLIADAKKANIWGISKKEMKQLESGS